MLCCRPHNCASAACVTTCTVHPAKPVKYLSMRENTKLDESVCSSIFQKVSSRIKACCYVIIMFINAMLLLLLLRLIVCYAYDTAAARAIV